jgi:hypothetical protein
MFTISPRIPARYVLFFLSGCGVLLAHDLSAAEPPAKIPAQGAQPLPLSAVRLTGGPLKHAQDCRYLTAVPASPSQFDLKCPTRI